MRWFNRKPKRYVAREYKGFEFLGLKTGSVDDLTPNAPSSLDRRGAGWEHVTTLAAAKRIARRANRKERGHEG